MDRRGSRSSFLLGDARPEIRGQIVGNRNDQRHALVLGQAHVAERPEYTVFEDRLDRALVRHVLSLPKHIGLGPEGQRGRWKGGCCCYTEMMGCTAPDFVDTRLMGIACR